MFQALAEQSKLVDNPKALLLTFRAFSAVVSFISGRQRHLTLRNDANAASRSRDKRHHPSAGASSNAVKFQVLPIRGAPADKLVEFVVCLCFKVLQIFPTDKRPVCTRKAANAQ